MEEIVIRVLKKEDYQEVYDLWLSVKGMGLNHPDDTEEGFSFYLGRNPNTCFAAVCGGVLCGVILAGHDGRRGYIYHTAVREEYRHRGIAGKLVSSAMEALKKEGIRKAALVVLDGNEAGNGFWEEQGFHARNDLTYRDKLLAPMKRWNT